MKVTDGPAHDQKVLLMFLGPTVVADYSTRLSYKLTKGRRRKMQFVTMIEYDTIDSHFMTPLDVTLTM